MKEEIPLGIDKVLGYLIIAMMLGCSNDVPPKEIDVSAIIFDYHAVDLENYRNAEIPYPPENIFVELWVYNYQNDERVYELPSKFDSLPAQSNVKITIDSESFFLKSPKSLLEVKPLDTAFLIFEVPFSNYIQVIEFADSWQRDQGKATVFSLESNLIESNRKCSLSLFVENISESRARYVYIFRDTVLILKKS